jgi:hypothetical protein
MQNNMCSRLAHVKIKFKETIEQSSVVFMGMKLGAPQLKKGVERFFGSFDAVVYRGGGGLGRSTPPPLRNSE